MASTYLSFTNGTPTNNAKFTISVWSKRSGLASTDYMNIINSRQTTSTSGLGLWWGNDSLYYNFGISDGSVMVNQSTSKYRDTNGWYHIVVAGDATQSGTDKLKFWINGEQVTSFDTDNRSSFTGLDYDLGNTIYPIIVGAKHDGTYYYNGLLSHLHFIDGTAYDASAFGQYDANGVWTIKTSPSVTYGNNGFFILKDGNSVTDQSGNSNNFTVGGGTLTNTEDCPSNVFCTYNLLATSSYGSLTHGNLRTIGINNAGLSSTYGTISTTSSGKWYWEIKINNTTSGVYPYIGIGDVDNPNIGRLLNDSGGATGETNYSSPSFHYRVDGGVYIAGSLNATYSSFAIGDIISFAVDMDNGASYIAKNGTWQNSGDPTSGASKTGAITTWTASSISGFLPSATFYYGASGVGNSAEVDANFGNGYFGTTAVSSAGTNASGNGIFEYDVPTGYTALSTKGLNL
jgi:hypothetical protein